MTKVTPFLMWVWSLPAGDTQAHRALYAELLDQAIIVGDAATTRLAAAARKAGIHVAIGINERNVEASGGSLYNSLLYLGADGEVLGIHDVPERFAFRATLAPSATGWLNPGDSVIVDPDGKVVAGPSHER